MYAGFYACLFLSCVCARRVCRVSLFFCWLLGAGCPGVLLPPWILPTDPFRGVFQLCFSLALWLRAAESFV